MMVDIKRARYNTDCNIQAIVVSDGEICASAATISKQYVSASVTFIKVIVLCKGITAHVSTKYADDQPVS